MVDVADPFIGGATGVLRQQSDRACQRHGRHRRVDPPLPTLRGLAGQLVPPGGAGHRHLVPVRRLKQHIGGGDVDFGARPAHHCGEADDPAVVTDDQVRRVERTIDTVWQGGDSSHVEPDWAGPPPEWFPSEFLWVVGCSYVGLPQHAAYVRNPIGASMAVRRRVFEEAGPFGLLLRFVQGGIGVLFMANIAVRLGAALMVILFLASTGLFGFVTSLEYFNFLGIALFLLLQSAPVDRLRTYALPALRIHTGIALGVLAWTEKLIDPNLAMRFLEKNQINFMKALGEHVFTDRFFVLCAGCTELIFALIFTLGLITRLNTLALAGFLVASNLYFFLIGKTDNAFLELTGHLPLLAIALLLILYGGGGKLRLTNLFFRRSQREPATETR